MGGEATGWGNAEVVRQDLAAGAVDRRELAHGRVPTRFVLRYTLRPAHLELGVVFAPFDGEVAGLDLVSPACPLGRLLEAGLPVAPRPVHQVGLVPAQRGVPLTGPRPAFPGVRGVNRLPRRRAFAGEVGRNRLLRGFGAAPARRRAARSAAASASAACSPALGRQRVPEALARVRRVVHRAVSGSPPIHSDTPVGTCTRGRNLIQMDTSAESVQHWHVWRGASSSPPGRRPACPPGRQPPSPCPSR